jgi:hypothetical protein
MADGAQLPQMLGDPARSARMLCAFRRAGRAEGLDQWEEERAARLVCQGVLTRREAEDALALVIAGRERLPSSEVHQALWMAQRALQRAVTEEERRRLELRWALRREVASLMMVGRPAREIMDRLRAVNEDGGWLFVWPELRDIAESEAAMFLRGKGARTWR